MKEDDLIDRITCDPEIFGGKPIIRGHRLAVEHVLDMLAAGDDSSTILEGFSWLEPEDIQACLVYASRLARHERIELFRLHSLHNGINSIGFVRLGRGATTSPSTQS